MEENKKTTIQETKEEIVKQDVELEKTVEEISNVKQMSPTKMVIRRFFRSKLSVIGLIIMYIRQRRMILSRGAWK